MSYSFSTRRTRVDSTRERERKKEREKGRKRGREHSIFLLFVMVFCVFDKYGRRHKRPITGNSFCLLLFATTSWWQMYAANAYPYLMEACGHPTRRREGHGAPTEDPSITFFMQWTNPDGQDHPAEGEDDRERVIPPEWSVGGNKYCKSCRMTITIRHNDENTYKEVVTVSHGTFFEQGRGMNGQSNNGVTCVGRRYGAEFRSNVHHYIWTAPDGDVGPIEVKVTGANGEFESFKFNSVTLEYDEAIKRTIPPGPPGVASPPPINHFDGLTDDEAVHGSQGKSDALKSIVAHGGIMLFSWLVFPPLLLYAGRFKESIFGKHWFLVHKYTVSLMGVFVLIALILAIRYRVEKGTTAELMLSRHGISGSITVACWLLQPIVAYFRPPKFLELGGGATTTNVKRTAWLWMHRFVAIFSVMFSIFAVRTGLNDHDPEMTFGRKAIENIWNLNFFVAYTVFAYVLIPILLEVLSRKIVKSRRKYVYTELEMGNVSDDSNSAIGGENTNN